MLSLVCGLALSGGPPLANLPTPSASMRAWQDLGVGMFIHFAPNTWQEKEYDDLSTPLRDINPAQLDTDQWAKVAKDMGARYVVLVAKHVGGFCLWPTATTDYSVKNIAWRNGKGDIVADMAASCRKSGLKLGVYLSPADAKHGAAVGGRCATPELQEAYNRLYRQQLSELLTNYGKMVEVWFDGSQTVPVADILAKHAKGAAIFQGPQATIRWVGNEDGFAPYPAWNSLASNDAKTGIATAMHGDPDGDAWMPLEVDVSMRRPYWFWSSKNHTNILSLDQLLEIYYKSVGRGANLLLNLTPDRTGRIPTADADRAKEFGDEVRRRFGRAVGQAKGPEIRFRRPTSVDHVILQEDLRFGERIRRYELQAETGKGWISLGTGQSVGQLRIHAFEPVVANSVRVLVSESREEPKIRSFRAFGTGATQPPNWNRDAGIYADDAVGSWDESTSSALSLDVTKRVQAAAVFRLRFVGSGGAKAGFRNAQVRVDGVAQPHLLRPDPTRPDVWFLTMPGLAKEVLVQGTVFGSPTGTVLIRRNEG